MDFITFLISFKVWNICYNCIKNLVPMDWKLFVWKTRRFVLIIRMRARTDTFLRMNASVSNRVQAS